MNETCGGGHNVGKYLWSTRLHEVVKSTLRNGNIVYIHFISFISLQSPEEHTPFAAVTGFS